MRCLETLARRALLAATLALGIGAQTASADTTAAFDIETGKINVTGLSVAERQTLQTDSSRILLRVKGQTASRGMPVTVATHETGLIITPRFALSPGTGYDLTFNLDTTALSLHVMRPADKATVPQLSGFAPSQAVIPANTLRLYLTFSESMSRGQVRSAVTLLRADGTEVPSPFLSLGPELWDPTQTRVTLLFDPGRIKQGVGPNLSHGAPLVEGETYHLVVAPTMESANGVPLATAQRIVFRAGPAETRPIDPSQWHIQTPSAGTTTPLSVAFDRIMDSGAVRRKITLEDADGKPVPGTLESDGGGWSLTPHTPWTPGHYTITVDPELEDVSGNAIGQAFDAEPGTIGTQQSIATRRIQIEG